MIVGNAFYAFLKGSQLLVILSEAKNLFHVILGFKILRFAQNDKVYYLNFSFFTFNSSFFAAFML